MSARLVPRRNDLDEGHHPVPATVVDDEGVLFQRIPIHLGFGGELHLALGKGHGRTAGGVVRGIGPGCRFLAVVGLDLEREYIRPRIAGHLFGQGVVARR